MQEQLVISQQFRSLAQLLWQDMQVHYPLSTAVEQLDVAHLRQQRLAYQGGIIHYLVQSSVYLAAAITKQLADTRFISIEDYSIPQIVTLLKQQQYLSASGYLLLAAAEQGAVAEIQQAMVSFKQGKPVKSTVNMGNGVSEQPSLIASSSSVIKPAIQQPFAADQSTPDEWPVATWIQTLNSLQQTLQQDMLEC